MTALKCMCVCVHVQLWVKLGIRAVKRGECLHSVWVSSQRSLPPHSPTETAIKEYLMWMQRVRERLRGQKECYITVAFRASGCYFMPKASTISIQNIQMCSHTCNPGRGGKSQRREKEQETYNNRDRSRDVIIQSLLQRRESVFNSKLFPSPS